MNLSKYLKNINWTLTGLVILLIITETLAQTSCERGASMIKNKKYLFVFGGVILYGLVGFLYYLALESRVSLAIVNIIWQTMTIIIVTLVSVFYFKQPISKKEIIGIIIVIIGSLFFVPSKTNESIKAKIAIAGKEAKNIPPFKNEKQIKRFLRLKDKKDL
jgi:drug/metabolite transporter (DMT)-like permease